MYQTEAPQRVAKDVILILPELYDRQAELLMAFYKNPAIRYLVGAFGSKAGKSYGASIVFVKHAWETPESVNWWLAPSYAQAEVGKDYVKKLLPNGTWEESKKDNMITLFNPSGDPHSEMWFKTTEDEDKLRGFRVHLIVADEMARIKDAAYDSFRTTITQTRGKIIFLSTPKGHNLFYEFFQRGNKLRLAPGEIDPYPDWFSMQLPTGANPWVTPGDIEDARRNMPEQVFRQEILAQFLDNASTVFGTYKDCVGGSLEGPGSGRYGVGLDLGRSHDYTVLTVMDLDRRHVVYFERFNQIDWQLQYSRIIDVCHRYNNATLIMDATSQGDPIFNTLQQSGLNIIPYRFYTNIAKREVIENLRILIEQKKITYPHIPELLRELEDYEINITPGGVVQYSAPRGRNKFDDCVISLGLVAMLVNRPEHCYIYCNESGV